MKKSGSFGLGIFERNAEVLFSPRDFFCWMEIQQKRNKFSKSGIWGPGDFWDFLGFPRYEIGIWEEVAWVGILGDTAIRLFFNPDFSIDLRISECFNPAAPVRQI